ncbi:hypothetical protein FRC03_004564 [Tulasnella sp. 419]|nr:hypothetical protein FRC03_004564 [Tulasnella sp. 419]
MGLFSSSRPSTPRPDSVTTAALGVGQISLTLLEKMTDGVPVPFVKAVAGTAVEVIKMARLIQANRKECDDLNKRCTSLLLVILSSLSGKSEDEIPSDLKGNLKRLSSNLHEVLSELKVIDTRVGKSSIGSKLKAGIYHFDNAEKLVECSAKIDWALQEFQVTSKVDSCLKDLERHEELRKGQTEIKKELKNEMQNNQAELLQSQKQILDAVKEKV